MTVPGGDSGEKAQDEPKQPPPPVGARPRAAGAPPSGNVSPPAWETQIPAQREPNAPQDSPNSPPSNAQTFSYLPPPYLPPSPSPPAAGYGPPVYQDPSEYSGPPHPPVSPEYGQPHPGRYPPPGYPGGGEQPETNTLAIVSLVASLVGLLCLVGSIVGIVFGAVAASQIKQTREPGYGLAIAAIVVGVATLVVYLIFAITIRMH